MVSSSRASDPSTSSSRSKNHEGEQGKDPVSSLSSKLSHLRKQIQASRLASIKEKIEANRKNLQRHTCELFDGAAVAEAATRSAANQSKGENLLSVRAATAPCRLGGWDWVTGMGEKEIVHTQEEASASGMLVIGSSASNKSVVRFVKLPYAEKIPPYMTWIFLDKNQRMAEDQSVVGRRRIYYDQFGNEALICSDTDEDIPVSEEEKHEFTEGEDQILRKAFEEHDLNEEVLGILCQFIDASPDDIEERCGTLSSRDHAKQEIDLKISDDEESAGKLFHDKTLSVALDSFDYLFCRRCLVFDCRLHGCSQNVIVPSEKQVFGIEQEENRRPCGSQCYLRGRKDVQDHDHNNPDASVMHEKGPKSLTKELCVSLPLESEDSNPYNEKADPINYEGICAKISRMVTVSSETSERSEMLNHDAEQTSVSEDPVKCLGKRKTLEEESSSQPSDKHFLVSADKKQKPLTFSHAGGQLLDRFPISSNKCLEDEVTNPDHLQKDCVDESLECLSSADISVQKNSEMGKGVKSDSKSNQVSPVVKNILVTGKEKSVNCWNTMEKDLYLKGIEIFGKNSCLIARNLLSGLKTCLEVANYMFSDGANLSQDDSGMEDQEYVEKEMPIRTRILRRRGRARKLKYTWKSAGHPSIRKRISNGKQQSCKQYTPCGCQQMCGKECSCMIDGTCCEKYCGCSKSCKNRFRGCHCAKSQCRSRQCPCFAAGRECDPDVCRNCWVSCGDGSLGEPPARGDGYQCGNMNLLLKQKKRILLARSDIAGWGAFIKNPVSRNDYLGEYTGELISHREADKRGKIYDRANSSFLFDLNDQFVLDAYRKGDKLKFANHSSNPNCYAKVMLVAGDHRVGIFAKERIEACEELFYDYRYGPDQAPAWARKPEGSKKDDSTNSHSRAHKVA